MLFNSKQDVIKQFAVLLVLIWPTGRPCPGPADARPPLLVFYIPPTNPYLSKSPDIFGKKRGLSGQIKGIYGREDIYVNICKIRKS